MLVFFKSVVLNFTFHHTGVQRQIVFLLFFFQSLLLFFFLKRPSPKRDSRKKRNPILVVIAFGVVLLNHFGFLVMTGFVSSVFCPVRYSHPTTRKHCMTQSLSRVIHHDFTALFKNTRTLKFKRRFHNYVFRFHHL